MTTDMANLQAGKSEGAHAPGGQALQGMEQGASITAAAVIVRGQDAGRTGSGQRSVLRRSLNDRGLPGHVADDVGRHFRCRCGGGIAGREHVDTTYLPQD